MRYHRLIRRDVTVKDAPRTSSTSGSVHSSTAATVDADSLHRNSLLTRRPVARAYRFKKESSICGITCSCCYHTSLKATRKRKTSTTMNTADSAPTSSTTNSCSTGDFEMMLNIATDDSVSSAPFGSSGSSCWPTADEKVNEENDKDNWSVAQVHGKEPLRNEIVPTDGAHIIPFITVERQGQKVQFAAKRPRLNSICSTLSATTAAAGTTIEDAVTLRERVPPNTNGGENAGAEVSLLNEEMNSQWTGTPSKKSDTSSESTPVCRRSKAKQKRIYIVTRWTPEGTPVKEGADDRASSPNESTVMKEPSPKRSKFAESEMESPSMRVTQCVKAVPARRDVVEVTQIVRSASTGNASDVDSTTSARPENQSESLARSRSHDSNSTTSTGLEEQEICQSTVRSQSLVSADSDNEKEDSEVTPRITRSRSRAAAMDSARNETTSSPITTRSRTLAEQRSETPTVPFRRSVRFRRVRMSTQMNKPSRDDNDVDEENSAQYAPAKCAPIEPRDPNEGSPSVDNASALLDKIFSSAEEDSIGSQQKDRLIPTSSRRRRRKIITMKKNRKKQFSVTNVVGSPVRRKIDIDEWVREGCGKYTRGAVVLFMKSQEEEQRLKKQRLSESGSIEWVNLGGQYKIRTWYSGNYPAEYSGLKTIYICDGCFSYFGHEPSQIRHMSKCAYRFAPPGDEIYHDEKKGLSVFEVHGTVDPMYCSNLCRLTMLWLENKVIFMDVEPFDFYVLTDFYNGRFRPLGYFSRQRQFFNHNLSCFCVFPCYQCKGYGTFLVDLSYMLSRLGGLPGGPERPFSAIGARVYKKYWSDKLFHLIYTKVLKFGWENMRLDIGDLARETGIQQSEVLESLSALCNGELTRNNRSLILKLTEDSVMEIGRYVAEKNLSRCLAKEEYLDPSFKEKLRVYGAEMGVL